MSRVYHHGQSVYMQEYYICMRAYRPSGDNDWNGNDDDSNAPCHVCQSVEGGCEQMGVTAVLKHPLMTLETCVAYWTPTPHVVVC